MKQFIVTVSCILLVLIASLVGYVVGEIADHYHVHGWGWLIVFAISAALGVCIGTFGARIGFWLSERLEGEE
jgi:MFS family permease